ncbi:MAG TPA: hypothetical protein VJS30_24630 [Paraburkholderia sp.]|nr:hypothetical protein [Paraburkholderia sp.]
MLPDGYPSTSDGDPAILRSGLHARVAEVGEQGIELVGIGTRDDAVEAFYPHAVVVRKLHEPPAVAFATLSRVLVQRSRRGEGGGRVACRKRLRVIPSVTPPP